MKKVNLFLVLLTALTVVSCSKDETTMSIPQETAIEFGTYLGRDADTRASSFTTSRMASEGFGVFAYYTDQADFDATTSQLNFMDNQKVTAPDSLGAWQYSPVKYWPNNDGAKVTFLAYAPWIGGKSINRGEIDFEVENVIKDQTDLVWNTANHIDDTKDDLTDNVGFIFKHALSSIRLSLVAAVDEIDAGGTLDENTTITVNSVTFSKDFKVTGKLDLTKPTATWSSRLGKQGFVFSAANGNFKYNVITGDSHNTSQVLSRQGDSNLMIIPQDLSDDGFDVTVNYNVVTLDTTTDGTGGGNTNVENNITRNVKLNLVAGNRYNLNLLIGVNSVDITASVNVWYGLSGPEVDIPVNN